MYVVTLTPTSNTNVCVGDDVIFSCTGGTPPFVWTTTGLKGGANVEVPARSLNGSSYPRYSSPDSRAGADSSELTIKNIQASELEATVLCEDDEDPRRARATVTLSSSLSIGMSVYM